MKPFTTRYFAHRGLHDAKAGVPENSMTAFRRAAETGYGIEMDVRLTADGQAVLFHDDTLERLLGCTGRIEDYTYEQLSFFPILGSEERIPLLKDVLDMVQGRVPLLIEIKMDRLDLSVCEETARLLDSYEGDYCVESFHPYVLYWFRLNCPLVARGQLGTNFIQDYPEVSLWKRVMMQLFATNLLTKPNFMSFRHNRRKTLTFHFWSRKLTTFGWTFRSAEEIRECRDCFDYFIFEREISS